MLIVVSTILSNFLLKYIVNIDVKINVFIRQPNC